MVFVAVATAAVAVPRPGRGMPKACSFDRAVHATAAVTSAAGEPKALYPASGHPSLSEDARIGLCGLATVLVVLLRVNVAHTEAGKF